MGNFNILPEEITLEILSCVPTESVLECKFVSKPWRNLLQHPSFPQMHLNHLNHLDSAHDSDGKLSFIFDTLGSDEEPFCYTEYDEKLNCFNRTRRINLRPPFQNCQILGSCNGLICFSAYFDNNYWQPAYICNPVTREYIVLPMLEGTCMLTGFGYSLPTNEYKVVRIFNSKGDMNHGIIQVYTLGSGIGWSYGGKMQYAGYANQRSVFTNGAIHWVDCKGTIVAFDLISEEFRELSSPLGLQHSDVTLHVLGDVLCAFYTHDGDTDIWVLKKNKSNHDVIWSKEFSKTNVYIINFTKSGGLLCYDFREQDVYLYAPKSSTSRRLVNFGKNFNQGFRHKNTLVSLKALGEEDTKLMGSGEKIRSSGETEIDGSSY